MINCEWIRKQKKERPSLGSSPGLKCKPNVRLRVRCANTQQPCFSALCDAWLLRKRDEIRESSYIKYRAILERHIKPRLGSRRLGGICTASVDAFTRELLETDGLSVKTVHDILSVLHSVLKDTEARRPAGALAVQIRYPKGKRREMRVLTIEEQKRLVAYLLHPTDSCKFGLLLALYTGLRIGELCALRWSSIDLREQTIRIAATMQRLGGTGEGTRIVIGAPKSDSSLRTIPLPAQIAVLCRHMQPADPEAYVLTGGPAYMEPRTLQYRLKRCRLRTEGRSCPHASAHLRHAGHRVRLRAEISVRGSRTRHNGYHDGALCAFHLMPTSGSATASRCAPSRWTKRPGSVSTRRLPTVCSSAGRTRRRVCPWPGRYGSAFPASRCSSAEAQRETTFACCCRNMTPSA